MKIEIQKLAEKAVNKNTVKTTKTWMNDISQGLDREPASLSPHFLLLSGDDKLRSWSFAPRGILDNLKYYSRYYCQIPLQLMLLPIRTY